MKGQRIYVQTFLLHHPRQSLSIVAPSSVRYHHPSIVRGHHLTYLFVAVTSTNLVHRSLIRFERHQKSRPAVHSPSRVVGVDEWTGTHRTPQLMVGIPHCTLGTSQRVLADRPLAQLHTSQRSEHSGDLPYRPLHSGARGPPPSLVSLPGAPSPGVWESEECRLRRQPALPHARVCLHIRGRLRENATTILPRGRALQGVGLSSMRFHPLAGDTRTMKTDKKHGSQQESHLLLDRPAIDWPCRT